jgi:hypothetical protein
LGQLYVNEKVLAISGQWSIEKIGKSDKSVLA